MDHVMHPAIPGGISDSLAEARDHAQRGGVVRIVGLMYEADCLTRRAARHSILIMRDPYHPQKIDIIVQHESPPPDLASMIKIRNITRTM